MQRGALADEPGDSAQPGQCCDTGCTAPEAPAVPVVRKIAGTRD